MRPAGFTLPANAEMIRTGLQSCPALKSISEKKHTGLCDPSFFKQPSVLCVLRVRKERSHREHKGHRAAILILKKIKRKNQAARDPGDRFPKPSAAYVSCFFVSFVVKIRRKNQAAIR